MAKYELVAFYKNSETEVSVQAARVGSLYKLDVRYEKVPELEVSISAALTEKTVLCLLNRNTFSFYKLMKYVYALNKPMLIVYKDTTAESYNTLKVPIGYLQENKEKVVWANFFQHYNESATIELVVPQEKDRDIAFMVDNNLSFIEHIFENSGARYSKTFQKGSFEKILKDTFISTSEAVVFIMRPFRIFSFYTPLNLRIYKRHSHTPTLIIPRDDELYIPCH